ncbi:MAG: hypothetical protein K1X67_11735 [Fimbriimonadaceae bacterium]|nr:hypothetical protein [Fimbriimonadaceae bacterium]
MRRTIIILPKLLGHPDGPSALEGVNGLIGRIAEQSEILRLSPIPRSPNPEAAFLGLDPREIAVAPGPLMVSAFGTSPPGGSVCLAVQVLSTEDGLTVSPTRLRTLPGEVDQIADAAKRLETSDLRWVKGTGLEHGLVWLDGNLELVTTPPAEVTEIKEALPEGEYEAQLRRFIDDSMNLLTSLEFNRRRADEGLPPLNLLWPWGQGLVQSLPNLALQRGEPAWVMSGSRRIQGLCRLVGYVHSDPDALGNGVNLPFQDILDHARKYPLTLTVLDGPGRLRGAGRIEEAQWVMRRLEDEVLQPLLDDATQKRTALLVGAPGFAPKPGTSLPDSAEGLAMLYRSEIAHKSVLPFDERALEGQSLGATLWKVVEQAMSSPAAS